ncbi:arylsulfatase [Pseudofrankia sp. BMG5.36]|uniref:arylsulfatase n=1 Tax=Pseudofrankia sp. BMG5.36 TaxID=1834512 RepID=UPI000A3EB24B|nr:arylsulfatase [Pseudofrankia sp. BMG5.36]
MPVETRPQLGMTVAESVPSYPRAPKPAAGAPNVVVILFDDMGFAQLGCYGSDIRTPNIDRLAAGGLRYNRFHVTSLCSPTRASLLTGRNHHAVGMGFLVDLPLAFPGYTGRIPKSAAALPRLLRDAGYNTFAVGKWHVLPRGERSPAGPFDRWPLGMGFERYYGFLQGDTNQWTPNLVSDNQYIDPPRRPEDGYHLSEDLADTAIRMVTDQQHAAPGKPFLLYFSLGAMHAPHQVAPEWVAPYQGQFDHGWDRWREEVFARQIDAGIVPAGTVLTERPPWVAGWDELTPDARRMHARPHEVYAGFLSHTDAQIGRLCDALERLGVLDNTLILLMSDNGASAEGGQHGTVNEHRFSNRVRETVEGNLASLEDWGGFRSYSHYSWGWAWAGNTPLRLWKRYTWLGGTRVPLVVHWPAGIRSRGEIRGQFCHAVDVLPTVLDVCGVEAPDAVDGVTQQPMDGASFTASFEDATAPAARQTQYFEMLGSRSIVNGRWKATTDHVARGVVDEEELMTGSRDFAADHWALFDLEQDFSEAADVAAVHPETVRRLQEVWLIEAGRNNVMPMSEGLTDRIGAIVPADYSPGNKAVFRPGGSPIFDESIPNLSFGFRMSVEAEVAPEGAQGVLLALGDWNGGYALYAVDGLLRFTLCPAGDPVTVKASTPLSPGRHCLSVTFSPDGPGGELTLACDGETLGSATMTVGVPFVMQHGGAHLCLGHDRGFPVCDDYVPPFPWRGAIHDVTVETPVLGRSPAADVRAALHAD